MTRRCRILLLGLGSVLVASAAEIAAPAYDWVLPLFTKEGYRTTLARGSKAQVVGPDRYEVSNLSLTFFNGDAAAKVETVILSPDATFQPDAKLAHGEQSVRFIRDEVEASGTRWVYDHANKKISLDGDVRVTFTAELSALLK